MKPLQQWLAEGEAVTVGGHAVFVHRSGAGPWLTLLHGFPTSSWDWAAIEPELARHFRILAFDFLGFGASDKPGHHRYSISGQTDLTVALWQHFGIGETAILAHDYGATVTQELLARHNQGCDLPALRSVVLLNAGLYPHLHRALPAQKLLASRLFGPLAVRLVTRGLFLRGLRRIFSPDHPPTADQLDQFWQNVCRHNGHRLSHRLLGYIHDRRRSAHRFAAALTVTDIPIGYIWGLADPVSGSAMAGEIRRRHPDAAITELADVGHYPQIEAPDRVTAAALAYLTRTPAAD
jgi:pimeloyl-ACP methyl ester carboxylesterase